jgi:ATP-dependent DNA ligase
VDGEIVVMSEDGIPDFNALQDSLDRNHSLYFRQA